jgi:drug/metabolite transporter (DMT)-like permease
MMDKEKLKGYLFGLMTAVCWATSPVFIQQGIRNLPSYLWGTAVGLSSAALTYFIWLLFTGRTELQKALQHRDTIVWSAAAGAAGGLGILARNTALGFNQVAVVIALAQTTGLFTLFFGPLLLGKGFDERITPKLVLGVVSIIAGSLLVIYGQSL